MTELENITKVLWQEIKRKGNKRRLLKKDVVFYSKMVEFSLDCSKDGTDVQVLMNFLAKSGAPMTFAALGIPEENIYLNSLAEKLAKVISNNKFGTPVWVKIALIKINNWAIKHGNHGAAGELAKRLIKKETALFKSLKSLKKNKIVFLGDSQMDGRNHWSTLAGFPHILDAAFKLTNKNLIAVNSGVGGNKVWQGLARLQEDVLRHKPQVCVFMFGANDCAIDINGKPEVPMPVFKKHYVKLVKKIRVAGIKPVMMSMLTTGKGINACYSLSDKYNAAITELARKLKVPLIDVYNKAKKLDLDCIVCADGLHWTTEGNMFLAKTMAEEMVEERL